MQQHRRTEPTHRAEPTPVEARAAAAAQNCDMNDDSMTTLRHELLYMYVIVALYCHVTSTELSRKTEWISFSIAIVPCSL